MSDYDMGVDVQRDKVLFTLEDLHEAYLRGFMASGDGYNGEILRDRGEDPAKDDQFLEGRFEDLNEFEMRVRGFDLDTDCESPSPPTPPPLA